MSDYPKRFAKGDRVKTAANRRQEVQLKFDGYKQVAMDITPTTDAPPPSHVDRVEALTGRDASDQASGTELTETEREADTNAAEARAELAGAENDPEPEPTNTIDAARQARKTARKN